MIKVSVRKSDDLITGFTINGHSGFADKGKDIVCAAISVLAINAVNSIESFTGVKPYVDESDGFLDVRFEKYSDEKVRLLLDSMVLGMQGVMEEYGKEFVDIDFADA